MTTKEYLEQYREDVPEWLKEYRRGGSRPLADFLRSRIVYYPGARMDSDPVEVFGASHSAHCFIYADYMLAKEELLEELHANGFWGYDVLEEVSFSESEVMRAIPWRRHFLSEAELREAARGTAEMREYTRSEPYALLVILERRLHFSDDHGPERLAILFLGADGIASFEAIFANGNAPRFFGFVLHDHGYGGNYNRFGRDGFLEKIMIASRAYPHFILTVHDSPYDGYAKVEWAEPAGSRVRSLFYREDIGCKLPNTEQQAKGSRI